MTAVMSFAEWRTRNPEPSLQALVERCGGYDRIPHAAWAAFDRERKAWLAELRSRHLEEFRATKRVSPFRWS
jgi:hypothetical protein